MSNPFAILADYPAEGYETPNIRDKVHREKNKHEPGTGRRDREKREGRGQSNWGNALDESKRATTTATVNAEGEQVENAEGQQQQQQPEEPKINYVSAANFFDDSDDEAPAGGIPAQTTKKVVNIPSQFANLIAEKREKNVEIRKYDEEQEDGLQTGFLNSAQAIQQRRDNYSERRGGSNGPQRGGPRGGSRGGPRGGRGGPRGGSRGGNRGGPRGGPHQYHHEDRVEGAEQPQQQQQQQQQQQPGQEGEQQQQRERKPRDSNTRTPRDRRPGNVQHQRDGSSHGGQRQPKYGNLSINNFPSLH